MNASPNMLALVLVLATACGRPLPSADSGAEASTKGETASTTETSSSTETSTTTTDTDSSDPIFVCPLDLPPPSCDPWTQDCPDGEKCVLDFGGGSWDEYACVPVLGDQPPGEPCMYDGHENPFDDCDATGFCWHVNEQGVGVCLEFCTGTPDAPECPEGSHCQFYPVVCSTLCDPLLQDCSDGLACYYDFAGSFECWVPADDLQPGAPCGFINDCAPGNTCLVDTIVPDCGGSYCCSPFCELGGDGQECGAIPGTTCLPLFEEGTAPPGYENVGVCILP